VARKALFAKPGPLRDRLIASVLRGVKTASSSPLAEWGAIGESLPGVGDRLALIDSDEQTVGFIELTQVEVIRVADVELDLAKEEGEEFESVADWREAHERFWRDEVIPALPGQPELSDETPLGIERFKLVEMS
jgi:uncharacterized protein YhfF